MKIKGFTLLELLITLTLFCILSVMGMASYSSFSKQNEQQVLINELRNALQFAKTQSIILDTPMFLEPLNPLLNWGDGMVLLAFNKKTATYKLLYQWQWHHPHWSVQWRGVNSLNRIMLSNNPTQAMGNGRFILVNSQTRIRLELILNRIGRIRLVK